MQPTDPDPTRPATRLTRRAVASVIPYVESWLSFRQRYLRIPGVQAAVLFQDELLMSRAYGHADIANDVPLADDHLFRVASHSKTFTGTAVLQLVDSGRVRLDDRLGHWLRFLAEAHAPAAAVTLRELLTHSSGLIRDGAEADFWQLLEPFPDVQALRALALTDTDVIPSNERFKYSNIAYGLLGLVVEAASGRPYNDYVTDEIVRRLGLLNTGPELDPARSDSYAVGYSSLAYAETRVPIDHVDTRALSAATGFYSTAADLCRYAAAHFPGDERLLSDAAKRVMQHEWWTIEGEDNSHYGLGFSIIKPDERRLLGHGGGFPGHITRTLFDPEDRFAVSILTNAIDGPADDLSTTVVHLLELAAKLQAETTPTPGGDRFCGRFANLWGVRDIAQVGDRLLLLDPTSGTPTKSYNELTVVDDATLQVAKGPGYAAYGEPMRYSFTTDGQVESVRGPGGMSWWPLEGYALPGDRVSLRH
ncbi:MAG: hypothetical protein QOJ90_283 [Actinomycetota bacterium]|nr:hypothetical protein [Actinomycetota bacterium]